MNVTVYAEKVSIDTSDSSVNLTGVDLNLLMGELNVKKVLDAFVDNGMGSEIKEYYLEHLNGENDEDMV